MADNINLLPQQSDESSQQSHQRKLINQVSAIVLIITIVAVVGLFAAQLYLGQQLKSTESQIATQTQRIQAKKNEEGIQRSLVERIHALDGFFASQNHYSQYLSEFTKTVPSTLKLKEMVIDENGQVKVTGAVANYADLSGFYSKLRSSGAESDAEEGDNFVEPMLTSVSRNEGAGTIEFGMSFEIGPDLLKLAANNGGAQ